VVALTLPLPAAAIVEIQQTLARYGHVVDNGDVDALDQIFTDDGVIFPPTSGHAPLRGLAQLQESIGSLAAPNHNPHSETITVDDDGTVRAWSRYSQWRVEGDSLVMVNGDYLDVLEETPGGWRISARRIVRRSPLFPGDELLSDHIGPWLLSNSRGSRSLREHYPQVSP
jgi:ketosteroid isomerase-like protein